MRHTCHGCPNLDSNSVHMGARIYFCAANDMVVPQDISHEHVTFWRVPLECPLTDAQVNKSAEKAPRRLWETIKLVNFNEVE